MNTWWSSLICKSVNREDITSAESDMTCDASKVASTFLKFI